MSLFTRKCCEECSNLIPIGEGDHICDASDIPTMVLVEYEPSEDYMWCKGKKFDKI